MSSKRKRAPPAKKATRKRSKADEDDEEEEENDWNSDNEDEEEEDDEVDFKAPPASGATPSRRSSRKAATKATKRLEKGAKKQEEEEAADELGIDDEGPSESSSAAKTETRYVAPDSLSWGRAGLDGSLHVLYGKDIKPSPKIASFDMDDTLIKTKSGRTFATGRADWQFLFSGIPAKLKSLHENGYRIVIFTNQAGVGKGKVRPQDIKGKIDDIRTALGVPLTALMATDEDEWRKPQPSMWQFFARELNGGVEVDFQTSFYCGDAAGRAASWDGNKKTKKDFSCSDRKFAANIGIPFKTPEPCFIDGAQEPVFSWCGINPAEVPKDVALCAALDTLTSSTPEMIILVGCAASGKSTFAKTHLIPKGYVHVNQDTLKNKGNCIKAAQKAVAEGKSVVIDNTNPSATVRAEYIRVAGDGMPVRCFVFTTPLELAQHLNIYREKHSGTKHVPAVGYAMFKKHFVRPSVDEGFTEVREINFKPHFASTEDEKLFLQFT